MRIKIYKIQDTSNLLTEAAAKKYNVILQQNSPESNIEDKK